MKRPHGLTDKQWAFCEEYLLDLNATHAARRAGFNEKTAGSMGNELLNKPEIKELIIKEMKDRSERTQITQDYVLNNIKEIGERCMQKRPITEWDRETKSYVVVKDEFDRSMWEFDASNALKAQELLGKHLNLWTDRKEVMGRVTLEKLVEAAGKFDE